VLERAAELQDLVPGAALVGRSAAALHAGHRLSFDHDHVVADLADRFDNVLDHLESLGDWSTAKVAGGKVILGELGGIETGVRQMIRTRPLEVEHRDPWPPTDRSNPCPKRCGSKRGSPFAETRPATTSTSPPSATARS